MISWSPLCFSGVTRFEGELLFAFPNPCPEIVRHALSQPVDSGLGMFPGTRHRKGDVYHPCVPIGRLEPSQYQDIARFVELSLAWRRAGDSVAEQNVCPKFREIGAAAGPARAFQKAGASGFPSMCVALSGSMRAMRRSRNNVHALHTSKPTLQPT